MRNKHLMAGILGIALACAKIASTNTVNPRLSLALDQKPGA